MDCFALAAACVLCTDQLGRGFLLDPDTYRMGTAPVLHTPKVMPISVFASNVAVDEDIFHDGNGSSLFIMERFLRPEEASTEESKQFVAFVLRCKSLNCGGEKSWHSQPLAPPPFVCEPSTNWNSSRRLQITAYGVVGSHVCISVDGVGTYCLDMESYVWSKVGDLMLPFHSKVEYVPELKLWFGLSAGAGAGTGAHHLAAADLSDMDSQQPATASWWPLEGA